MFYFILVLILLTPVIWWVLFFYWSVLRLRHLPPGPFPLPLFGNLHLIRGNMEESLRSLATKYGDMMTVYFGHKRAIIVSSPELAREVLVRQSTVFGGRPTDLPYAVVLGTHDGKAMGFRAHPDSTWKKQRKLFHGAMKSFGTNLLVLENQICRVLEDLVGTLGKHQGKRRDVGQDIHLSVTNVICTITFGSKYNQDDEEFLAIMENFQSLMQSSSSGNLIDVIPLLRKLPIKQVLDIRNAVALKDSIVNRKYHEHELTFDGDNIRDLTDALLKQHRSEIDISDTSDDIKLTEEEIQLIISDTFVAGVETSSTSVLWGIYYLALNPDIQDRAYDEMRLVLEPDELPTFRDRRRLAFVQATVTEVFRCSSVAPLLLPHRAISDAVVGGYNIPADTTVLVNSWAIHHDPRIFPDPLTFNPARFINQDGNYLPPSPNTFFPFSAGKRACVGEVLAKMVVFLSLARLLYYYRFSFASDRSLESSETESSLVRKPKPFEVVVERR